jgi:two-component system cell cycle response regulator DivK
MAVIAVVDDSRTIRYFLRVLLEGRHETVEYEDGAGALAGIAAGRPDLVLLDISLPDMDGTEVLERLRGDPALADLPVIALTGHAEDGDQARFLALGFDAYLTKPITDEGSFFGAIDRLLP